MFNVHDMLFRGFHECEDGGETIVINGKSVNGKWCYGFFVPDLVGDFIGWLDDNNEYNEEKVIPETLGIYTMMDDDIGEKIFTGDIVSSCIGLYLVEFERYMFTLRNIAPNELSEGSTFPLWHWSDYCTSFNGKLRVITNIYSARSLPQSPAVTASSDEGAEEGGV